MLCLAFCVCVLFKLMIFPSSDSFIYVFTLEDLIVYFKKVKLSITVNQL